MKELVKHLGKYCSQGSSQCPFRISSNSVFQPKNREMQDPQPSCSDLEEAKKTLQILLLVSEHDEEKQLEDLVGKLLIQWSSLDRSDRVNLLLYLAVQHVVPNCLFQLSLFDEIAASEGGIKFLLDLHADLLIHMKTVDHHPPLEREV